MQSAVTTVDDDARKRSLARPRRRGLVGAIAANSPRVAVLAPSLLAPAARHEGDPLEKV